MNRTLHRFLAVSALVVLLALPAVGFAQKDPAPSSPGTTVTDPKGGASEPLPGQPTTAQAQGGDGFVSLTQIPAIEQAGRAGNIAGLLNYLYLLCVGVGAILAVLQMLRGGLTYMLSDSVTNKKDARDTIVMALVGLLLVLSPTIVFGIIDPRILNLQVDFSPLKSGIGTGDPGLRDDVQTGGQGSQQPTDDDDACGNPPCPTIEIGEPEESATIRWTVTGTDAESYYGYAYPREAQFQHPDGPWLPCYQAAKAVFGNRGNQTQQAASAARTQCETQRNSRPGASACIELLPGNSVEYVMTFTAEYPGYCPLTPDMRAI